MSELVESVRKWVIANLPFDSSDTEIVQALNSKDAHGLLVVYHNWVSRLVRPVPRSVEKSSHFHSNAYRQIYHDALNAIEADIVAGHNLQKYLSRGVRVALKLPSRRVGASDLDMLLNDWGVHHLHLSTSVQSDGFVSRTGPLLFVRFTEDAAYFLDIAEHGQWTPETVLDAIVNEFPDAGGVSVVRGIDDVSHEYTEEEHQKLRKAGVNIIRMVGGKAVTGGGFNIQGHTITAVREADRLLEALGQFEKYWSENEDQIRQELQHQSVSLPKQPVFEFAIGQRGPYIVEAKSGTGISIPSY